MKWLALICAAGLAALLVLPLFGVARLRVIHVLTLGAPLFVTSMLAYQPSGLYATIIGVCTLLLVLGYYTAVAGDASARSALATSREQPRRAPVVLLFVAIFTAVHFALAGVPVLQSNIEVARFDLGASGLGGLPSRMYLFGTVVGFFWAIAEARERRPDWFRDRWVVLAGFILLVSRLLGGFKSGLLQSELILLLAVLVGSGGIVLPRVFGRILIGLAASISAVLLVGSTYASYASSGSVIDALERRVTSDSVEPVAIVLSVDQFRIPDDQSVLGMDARYFADRYFSIESGMTYGFTRWVSATWVGGSPTDARIYPPVTLNGSAVLIRQFGLPAAAVTMLLLGRLLGKLELHVRQRGRRHDFTVAGVGAVIIMDFISKGEIVYAAINWSFSIVVLILVSRTVVSRSLGTRRREALTRNG